MTIWAAWVRFKFLEFLQLTFLQARSPSDSLQSFPRYISPSYQWLVSNLHNPYPSKEIKNKISHETQTSSKDIDGWFVDARRRIGWNALRKSRFSNKRADIIEAATLFFVKADPKCPLDPIVELAFASIESSAKDLYSEKLSESTLVTSLDMAVKDMTPEIEAQSKANRMQRNRLERQRKAKANCAALAYPSPDRSPITSSDENPLPPSDQDSLTTTNHASASSSLKRRHSSSRVSLDNDTEPHTRRATKRCRYELFCVVDDTLRILIYQA